MPYNGTGEYITLEDAARSIGISPETLDRWARKGRIPSELTDTGTRLFLRTALGEVTVEGGDPPPQP